MKEKKKMSLKKILSLCLFGGALIFSGIFTGKVVINYNLSDYLDDSTETKIALKINEEEFGPTGNVQVMAKNVDENKAETIYYTLKGIDNVANVNFDLYDTNYYSGTNALYIVLIDGDDYSQNAKQVVADIKTALADYGQIEYGGTAVEKQSLQNTITNEMFYILLTAVCLVAGILLLTAESWIEPIVLLLCCGVAVVINRGTNIFFGNISYITNSISAILQLALSIDYSIVLLHEYRAKKKECADNDEAMKMAIKAVIRPISASSLTTIAGLLALLFMSFHIGFDIGSVLMKGIVISALTSLTLLPVLVLMCDKLMAKTRKKILCPSGKPFANLAVKGNKAIFPLGLVLIAGCGYLQTNVPFVFTDSKSGNQEIIDAFGQNNSLVVLYKNRDDARAKEAELIESVDSYRTKDGDKVLLTYTSYGSTVEETYDAVKLTQKASIDEEDASLLLSMYSLYQDPDQLKLTFSDFVHYTYSLAQTDDDVKEAIDAEMEDTLKTLIQIEDFMGKTLSAEDFYTGISAFDGCEVSWFSVEQMYGLYFYEDDHSVDFQSMLSFILLCFQDENMSSQFDESTVSSLQQLSQGIASFNAQMEQPMTKTQLKGYIYSDYGTTLSDAQLNQIYSLYYASLGQEEQETIPFLPLMKFMVSMGLVSDADAIAKINQYDALYSAIHASYSYQEFPGALGQIAYGLSGQHVSVTISDASLQQIYIAYVREAEEGSYQSINAETFVNFILETAETNEVVANQLSEQSKAQLTDMLTIESYMADPSLYNYKQMYSQISELKERVQSKTVSGNADEYKVSGPYIKFLDSSKEGGSTAKAVNIVNFVKDNMDSNTLLINKLNESKRAKISEASEDIVRAESLLKGENYSRLLLSVNLSNGGEDSSEFVQYLEKEVKSVFGEEAHVMGEMVSVNDLKSSFSHDNTFITVFTIISIFVIVLLVFRSLSLPTLLVAIIQGAVFITMSTQIFSSGVFFMSYIIVTCILMGATIDYGILMSNNYIANRGAMDKKTALGKAVESAMPTIFTSGLILVVCGFVISLISSQSSISTVGLLIGIGGLSSIAMILLVLPATLYLLDGFVMKLTLKTDLRSIFRKKKNNGD